MEKHYGKEDEKDVQMIKDLYLELDLPAIYAAAEEELFLRIETHIRQTYNGQLQEALLKLLKQRYNFKNSRLSDIC
ncbi:unnamed protein product [Callosobruchus maculatus]|uniref:Uncharacterized protein n=1 Tax=Callosobruchus maculatus TaxID=64391 RepID=A0A653CR54_CALMS|nr:unnamed protein product [Callosobruchus maculatus]